MASTYSSPVNDRSLQAPALARSAAKPGMPVVVAVALADGAADELRARRARPRCCMVEQLDLVVGLNCVALAHDHYGS